MVLQIGNWAGEEADKSCIAKQRTLIQNYCDASRPLIVSSPHGQSACLVFLAIMFRYTRNVCPKDVFFKVLVIKVERLTRRANRNFVEGGQKLLMQSPIVI